MDKKTYTRLSAEGAAGTRLAADVWDELAAFAKDKRLRNPDPKWRLEEARPRRTTNKGNPCSSEGCGRDSYCKGLCSAHYAKARREDPAEREKAREASRRSHAKRKAAAAEATT